LECFKGGYSKVLGQLKRPKLQQIVKDFRKVYSVRLCHELKSAFPKCSSGLISGKCWRKVGERFHQDIKKMETRYQGRWNVNMMGDYCSLLHRDEPQATYKKVPNEALKEK
jgi:hypothetical protein